MPNKYRERITQDPHIVGGEPVFRGTRVPVRTVLASLAEGATAEEILSDFPTLGRDDVRAAVAFAAASAQDQVSTLFGEIVRCLWSLILDDPLLRGLMQDYVYGVRPGSQESTLVGTPEHVISEARIRLGRHLAEAVIEVAEIAEPDRREALRKLAKAITSSVERAQSEQDDDVPALDDQIGTWIGLSKPLGAVDKRTDSVPPRA
jgi:uncharacterized protein (DUF433 family)